jgi:hypothetical protein
MTPATARSLAQPVVARSPLRAGLVATAGCAVLASRPALVSVVSHPTLALTFLYAALLVVGTRIRVAGPRAAATRTAPGTALAYVVGVLAFVLGRLIGGGHPATRLTVLAIALNTLAAIAEEAWFRRLCYGIAEPAGATYAVVTSAALFALVHLAAYGPGVLPLDFAVGLLLGWQRATTGSWTVPAWTHAIANLVVLR